MTIGRRRSLPTCDHGERDAGNEPTARERSNAADRPSSTVGPTENLCNEPNRLPAIVQSDIDSFHDGGGTGFSEIRHERVRQNDGTAMAIVGFMTDNPIFMTIE